MLHLKLHRRAVVPAALSLVASCSDAPTAVAPARLDRAAATASARAGYVASGHVMKRTFVLRHDVSVTESISPDGGLLSLPAAGLVLYFPAGAVAQPTVVTATALKGNRVVYDFQPHGLRFGADVYVIQTLLRTELGAPRAARKQPGVWAGYLPLGAGDIHSDGRANFAELFDAFFQGQGSERLAVFTTTHFSGYAFATGLRGPPVPLSTDAQ